MQCDLHGSGGAPPPCPPPQAGEDKKVIFSHAFLASEQREENATFSYSLPCLRGRVGEGARQITKRVSAGLPTWI